MSCSRLPRLKNISVKVCRENQITHFMPIIFFPRKSCLLWDNVLKKHGRTGQATNDNMAFAHCMLYT